MQKVIIFLVFCAIFARVSLAYPYQEDPYNYNRNILNGGYDLFGQNYNPYDPFRVINNGYDQGGLQYTNGFGRQFEQNYNFFNPYHTTGGYDQLKMQQLNYEQAKRGSQLTGVILGGIADIFTRVGNFPNSDNTYYN
uniref:Putative secreted protein n=1 Tax=Lutzomyia longipalpis TaxID=7200 RepID=A0A7G3APM1_LUTLO